MLLCLCGPPSISLSFSLAAVLPRRRTYRVSLGTGPVKWPHPECAPFKVGTTRVSNPVCSPDFRASASVPFKESAFASGVLQDINAFHRYTLYSDSPSRTQSMVVSSALSGLGPEISHLTRLAAYAPFTPSKSEQRSWPLYYRGCWHRVSRQFLLGYTQLRNVLGFLACSPMTGVYNPKAFILHAASHCQAFAHCK